MEPMVSNRYQRMLVLLVAALLCRELAAAGAAVVVRRRGNSPVASYQRVELEVQLSRQYRNPFDPDEIAVDAQITDPNGKHFDVPGFWGQDFPNTFDDPHGIKAAATGAASFRVRFCATSPGRWSVVVRAKDDKGVSASEPMIIDVEPSKSRGFIRVSPENRQYLQFDSGDAYFPIGLNLAWTNGEDEKRFVPWLDKLSKAGGNFARIWLCHPPVRIENEVCGLGKYDLRNAAFFDDLLELAETRGIDVMLTISNHRELLDRDMWGAGHWPNNPYNADNGGPARLPIDFFTDPVARKLYRQRLRYLVARYSAYTNIACWELFNEQENTRLDEIPIDWNEEMAGYLKEYDPYGHLISTSAAVPEAVWEIDAMSLTQSHVYGDGENNDLFMPVLDAPRKHEKFGKPHFIGECAIDFNQTDAKYDPDYHATSMHNSLWASTMSGACGASAYWWWHNYVDTGNLWGQLTPIAKFAAGIDWPKSHFKRLLLPAPQLQTSGPETFSDLMISSSGAGSWGKANDQPIAILPSGQVSGALPYYIYGPSKPELLTRPTLCVDLAQASKMTLHIAKVSDRATLRVWVDDELKQVYQYDASPGMPGLVSTSTIPQDPNTYQAIINADRIVPLTVGKHKITLDMSAGDWTGIDRITFSGAKSSRYADLLTTALQDDATGQTLVWLYDATSTWQNDSSGTSGREVRDAVLSIPVARSGMFNIMWWDTRAGKVIGDEMLASKEGKLLLTAPAFRRDVALKITPAKP